MAEFANDFSDLRLWNKMISSFLFGKNITWKWFFLKGNPAKNNFFVFLASCTNQDLIGDGKCNKKANTAECFFDGGDCCSLCETITVLVHSFFIFENTDHTG